MIDSKNHHFVPEWYQRQFLPPEGGEFFVLDKSPLARKCCPDGAIRSIKPLPLFRRGPNKLFRQSGLYSVALRGIREDSIERLLFGQIDSTGARANAMFQQWPVSNGFLFPNGDEIPAKFGHPSHRIQDLLTFMNAQKARTPKGIDQIKHALAKAGHIASDNSVLMEFLMRRRELNCTVWAEGMWEIFSAKKAALKFIFSDDPVVIYNCDCYPGSDACQYPHDPDPFWRGSRVIYPLCANAVLVISHNEHVDDPSRQKARRPRRNARVFDQTLINYMDVLNQRELSDEDVAKINSVIKIRATRYVASATKANLFPEDIAGHPRWCEIDKLFYAEFPSSRTKTETMIKYEDGSIMHTNAFGERDIVPGWFVRQQEAKRRKLQNG
jgi:hypothetical protein